MPSAPLAGRPPYATDDDDSVSPPPKPDNPNNRTSAYDVYNDYLPDGSSKDKNPFNTPPATPAGHLRAPKDTSATDANRQSGVGGIGMGLLNMDFSDSEDEDDDDAPPKKVVKPAAPSVPTAAAAAAAPAPPATAASAGNGNNSKNAALLAAIGNIGDYSTPKGNNNNSPPKSNLAINNANQGNSRSPPPIAAPRPGYAAPVPATFGQNPFEGPAAQPIGGVPTPVSQPSVQIPPAAYPRDGPPHSPLPLSLSPAPLQAPANAHHARLCAQPSGDKEGAGVKFEVGTSPLPRNKPIMRSQTEDPLLPRRGEKGDDFWRRFSMVAREDSSKGKKESSWLHKTKNGINVYSRWVWVIGLVLLLAIVGAIALGVVLSMGKEDEAPKEPTILAGNTSKAAGAVETAVAGGGGVAPAGGPGGGGAARAGTDGATTSRAVLHVTPTHTIRALAFDTEGIVMPVPTAPPVAARAFGAVDGLVKDKRNSSSERSGRRHVDERRRGHRVRRWD
ncbi:hypothetical protein BKA70DRAFT_1330896 [Coprinopsis sp. MPI-PUGE-AT-0042]|nr:hypothetical protein BKA70DRAFT_1330896 [Coprinopsis sp. MPI-PUGE-AT-0042]